MDEVRIFCEGESDKDFLIKFIVHLKNEGLIEIENPLSLFEIKESKSKLLNLQNYDFNKLKKISKVLFIMDCDFEENDKKCGGCENTRGCLNVVLEEFKNKEIEANYFLFKNNLESFILNTLDESSKKCLNDLKECFSLKDKAKHQKSLICIYKGIYPQEPFNFSHQSFDELKNKILWLFKE